MCGGLPDKRTYKWWAIWSDCFQHGPNKVIYVASMGVLPGFFKAKEAPMMALLFYMFDTYSLMTLRLGK